MPGHAFDSSARWYDVLAGGARRLEREGNLLLGALRRAPSRRVLDSACGTGLHALFLAENGGEVAACDLSAEMIEYAREHRPHPSVRHTVADMRTPPPGPYGLALCLGNSLSLLDGAESLEAFFRNTAAVLEPGGLLLAQLLNYANPALRQYRQRVENGGGEEFRVRAEKTFTPRADGTVLHIEFSVTSGGETLNTGQTVLLRHWDRATLERAASVAGLQPEECLGSFDGAPYAPESSPDLIMLWRRD